MPTHWLASERCMRERFRHRQAGAFGRRLPVICLRDSDISFDQIGSGLIAANECFSW
ncbi:MAG: hypothetical protein QOD05_2344 [Microbacteriaceae bacterium]|nr:hypothetical protein [Microbacteriaceae bacterium]